MIFKKKNDDLITPKIHPSAKQGIFGHVDTCSIEGVTGWAINIESPYNPLNLRLFLDSKLIAETMCEHLRGDIVNLTGFTVKSGFIFSWSSLTLPSEFNSLPDDHYCELKICPANDSRQIKSNISRIKITDIHKWLKKSYKSSPVQFAPKFIESLMKDLTEQTIEPIAREGDVKLIAYYLPQFHPILENNEWWGPGFTEWTNVSQAIPTFKNHYQPHVPGELGYYDLRLPEVREAQAKLAREHGIYGFCYYYYWFAGRRLLERPLQEVFESGKPDFPFCICWANENWSRRWDGSENEILVQQVHDENTDEKFIHDVIPLLKDPRYIKLNNAPILIIYRISLMPNPSKTAQTWRRICAENGIPNIHLCMSETFGDSHPYKYGFDSSVQFPPHGVVAEEINNIVPDLPDDFFGKIYDIESVVKHQISKEPPTYKCFPGVMTSWDNTARKKKSAHLFLNSSPDVYELWLRSAIDQARAFLPDGEKLVFINAWNEWAEGAHLEPDRKNGRAYLEATRSALSSQTDWNKLISYAQDLPSINGSIKEKLIKDLNHQFKSLSMVNNQLLKIMGNNGLPKQWSTAKLGSPIWLSDAPQYISGLCRIDQINHYTDIRSDRIAVCSSQKLYLYGWSLCSEIPLERDTPSYLIFTNVKDPSENYFCLVPFRHERKDVVEHFPKLKKDFSLFAGIKITIDISNLNPADYYLHIAMRTKDRIVKSKFEVVIETF